MKRSMTVCLKSIFIFSAFSLQPSLAYSQTFSGTATGASATGVSQGGQSARDYSIKIPITKKSKTKHGEIGIRVEGDEDPISPEESSEIINKFNTAYDKASPSARPQSYNSRIKIKRKGVDGKEREVEVSVDFTGNGIKYSH